MTNPFGIHFCQNKSNRRAPSVLICHTVSIHFSQVSQVSPVSHLLASSRTFSQVLASSRKFSHALARFSHLLASFSQAPLRVFLPPSLSRGPRLFWCFSPLKSVLFFSKKNSLICLLRDLRVPRVWNQFEPTFSGKRVFRHLGFGWERAS